MICRMCLLQRAKFSLVITAVKSYVAEGFLSANGVDFERAETVEEMRTADIAEKEERFTVLVECWE